MDNLTLISCSFNTPDVTLTMLRSFFKNHEPTKVLICDNSTNEETYNLLLKEKVPCFRNKGGLHSSSVDLLFDSCKTDYALLVDTDVVFLQNHVKMFEQFKQLELTLMGEVCGNRGGKELHNRVHPWHCFINVKNIKDYNIKFYDPTRLSNKDGKKIYDVGASFFEDIKKAKLRIGDVNLNESHYKHYEGMSWRVQKFGKEEGNIDTDSQATHNNLSLYNYGLMVQQMYQQEIENYKNVEIKAL